MVKQKSDNERMEQSRVSLKRPQYYRMAEKHTAGLQSEPKLDRNSSFGNDNEYKKQEAAFLSGKDKKST